MRAGTAGRRLRSVLAAPLRRRHHRALRAALHRYETPRRDLWRYFTMRGKYPYRCSIHTPAGEIAPVLHGPHDMVTVHEIFCAGAYPIDPDAAVVVDFGANIGISALYFLTEAPRSRVHVFEANPTLIGRLRENLEPFADRVAVNEVAVSTYTGVTAFGVEMTGRYGGIVAPVRLETLEVLCLSGTAALEQVLREEGRIDLLKIDVEGTEVELLRSMDPAVLDRVGAIAVETAVKENPLDGRFAMRRADKVSHLARPPT
jgi:FkbM family methyltransferase